jgi:hypothetical protein
MKKLIYVVLFLQGQFSLQAQKLAEWSFENISTAIPSLPIAPSFLSPDVASGQGGMSGGNNIGSPTVCSGANAWSTNFWPTASQYSSGAYVYFMIEAKKDLQLFDFSFSCGASSGSSAKNFAITYTLDGETVQAGGGSASVGSCGGGGADLDVVIPKGSSFTIRIHPYGQDKAAQAATLRFDNVRFSGALFLPITLARFEGQRVLGQGVRLFWQTGSSHNNDYIAIEKSTNAQDFEEIGRIEQVPDGDEKREFTFWDHQANTAAQYYRLRTVDQDGSQKFSKIIVLPAENPNAQAQPYLYPNPVIDQCSIRWLQTGLQTQWHLANSIGQKMPCTEISSDEERTVLDLSRVPAGSYYLHWQQGQQRGTMRVQKI